MTTSRRQLRVMQLPLLGAGLLALHACDSGATKAPGTPGAGLDIKVAPLTLPGIGDACYDVLITNGPGGTGETIISRGVVGQSRTEGDTTTLCASRFGNGPGGDLSYVSPCDADTDLNSVTLWIDGLYPSTDPSAEDIGDWQDPCENGCVIDVACAENADTPVNFNFTVLRQANQGFFDVAVNFEDIFCSAKLDCVDEYLFYPSGHANAGQRGPTAIAAFACAAGEGEETFLHLNYLRVRCEGPPESFVYIDPTLPEGNTGTYLPPVYQAGLYYGQEGFQNIDKCYWNVAVGIDPAQLNSTCWLEWEGTASSVPWPNGQSPANDTYPYFQWSVQLNTQPNALDCGAHPVNGPGSSVTTHYTVPPTPMVFAHSMDCGEPPETHTPVCTGTSGNVPGPVSAAMMPEGLVVFAGGLQSAPLALPADMQGWTVNGEGNGCCIDPCCAD